LVDASLIKAKASVKSGSGMLNEPPSTACPELASGRPAWPVQTKEGLGGVRGALHYLQIVEPST